MKKANILFIVSCLFLIESGLSSVGYKSLTVNDVIKLAITNSHEYSLLKKELNKTSGNNWFLSLFIPQLSANYNFSYDSTTTSNFSVDVEIPISPLLVLNSQRNIHNLKESMLRIKLLKSKMEAIDNSLNLYNLLSGEKYVACIYKEVISKASGLAIHDKRSMNLIEDMKLSLKQHLITIKEMTYDLKNMLSVPQAMSIKLGGDILSSKYFHELLHKINYDISNGKISASLDFLISSENKKILKEKNAIEWISNSVSLFLNLNSAIVPNQDESKELSYGIKVNIFDILNLFSVNLVFSNTSGITFSFSANKASTESGLFSISNFTLLPDSSIQSQYKQKITILYDKMLVYREQYDNALKNIPSTFTNIEDVEGLYDYLANIENLSQFKSLYVQTVLSLGKLLNVL